MYKEAGNQNVNGVYKETCNTNESNNIQTRENRKNSLSDEEALKLFDEAIKLSLAGTQQHLVGYSLQNMATLQLQLDQLDEAEKSINAGAKTAKNEVETALFDSIRSGLALKQALANLKPEQREIIEKAYMGELTHQEISQQTGLPLGTIKSKIRRGIERLRGDVRRALNAAVLCLGWPNARRLAVQPGRGSGGCTTATRLVRCWQPALLMLTLSLLVFASLWAWADRHDGAATTGDRPMATSRPRLAETIANDSAPFRAEVVQSNASSARPQCGPLEVTVRWSDRTPAAGVWLRARPEFGSDPTLREHRARTSVAGTARFAHLEPGKWRILSDRAGARTATLRATAETQVLTFDLPAGITVSGRVVDRQGNPAVGALIWLASKLPHWWG